MSALPSFRCCRIWGSTIPYFGLAAGLFFVGYVLFETPSNFLQAKVGARVWIARIMVSWGLLSMLCAAVSSAWHLYTLRFLLGIAEAGFLPGVLFYLSGWFPSHQRGRVFSLFQACRWPEFWEGRCRGRSWPISMAYMALPDGSGCFWSKGAQCRAWPAVSGHDAFHAGRGDMAV
jgi:hypothetical protein